MTLRARLVVEFALYGAIIVALAVLLFGTLAPWTAVEIFVPTVLLLLFAFGWRIASVMTADFRRLSDHLQKKIDSGSLKTGGRFSAETREMSELGSFLAASIEKMKEQECQMRQQRVLAEGRHAESSTLLSNFMYYVSHVLRTPLNSIRWAVEMLKNEEAGPISPAQRELLDELESSAVELAGVSNELQDTLIVVRGNTLRSQPSSFDLFSLVDEVAGHWAVAARRKNIRLLWSYPRGESLPVQSDHELLRRALDCLIDNAVHYSPADTEIAVALEAFPRNPDAAARRRFQIPKTIRRGGCLVMVRDQGIGIPRADLPQIFNPFFRARNAKDLWVDAKGIGLTLARAIARQLGGDLWLQSQLKRGTVAYLYLPSSSPRP